MRTTIKQDGFGDVTLTYFDPLDEEWVTRTFRCPFDGGYVYELTPTGCRQVFERLSYSGNAITSPSRDELINVIRGEYRRMRDAEKREAARYRGY